MLSILRNMILLERFRADLHGGVEADGRLLKEDVCWRQLELAAQQTVPSAYNAIKHCAHLLAQLTLPHFIWAPSWHSAYPQSSQGSRVPLGEMCKPFSTFLDKLPEWGLL